VLEAAIRRAKRRDRLLLIEATSNQVNQFGGYTGQNAADFARFVYGMAASNHLSGDQVLLGGDHLRPHPWRKESAAIAMEKAVNLVQSYVLAGFKKIHLDASMHCADDPGDRNRPLADELGSERAAILCEAAEKASRELPQGFDPPLYVIRTEVPIPGGETQDSVAPSVTQTEDLEQTIKLAKESFFRRGLRSAWDRVIAIVVQPVVEFGDSAVFDYDSSKATALSDFGINHWHGVFEAHSTDYQSPEALRHLVSDHFAILKVGPWLTFAFREAVFALASVEEEWLGKRNGVSLSHIREELELAMLDNPSYWRDYYERDDPASAFARRFSYSDRIRYDWTHPKVGAALERLINNLTLYPAPLQLLSQYLPGECGLVRSGMLRPVPSKMILARIDMVLDIYEVSCDPSPTVSDTRIRRLAGGGCAE
jgi:D-tagatose-1,6-bisphosphate aldolase subunit GatZ/KbaZ